MRWMRERDALIAQTMAFVHSVTGRAGGEPRRVIALDDPNSDPAEPNATEPGAEVVARAPEPTSAPSAPTAPAHGVAAAGGRPMPASELRRECDARVASFRAHQERFNREREEYFAATLARLRAALKDGSPSPRHK